MVQLCFSRNLKDTTCRFTDLLSTIESFGIGIGVPKEQVTETNPQRQ